VKDCITSREDVVTKKLYLLIVNEFNTQGVTLELLHDLPMEEGETHVCYVHTLTVINLIVDGEQLWVQGKGLPLVFKVVGRLVVLVASFEPLEHF
jgi:hypothetical protein